LGWDSGVARFDGRHSFLLSFLSSFLSAFFLSSRVTSPLPNFVAYFLPSSVQPFHLSVPPRQKGRSLDIVQYYRPTSPGFVLGFFRKAQASDSKVQQTMMFWHLDGFSQAVR